MNRWLSGLLVGLFITFIVYTYRQDRPVERAAVPTGYGHDRYGTQPIDQRRDFAAFVS